MKAWVGILSLLVWVGPLSARALAQTAPPAAAPPAAAPAPAAPTVAPDVVRLKSGGLLRGTIAESEPGQFVVIVLITGETRKVAAADVQYAGPSNAEPGAIPPPPAAPPPPPVAPPLEPNGAVRPLVTIEGPAARVQFESTPPGVTLQRRAASAGVYSGGVGANIVVHGFEEICTAPCRASLPAGTYTFGASQGGGRTIEAEPVTLPPGESTLTARWQSRGGVRAAGWLIAFGSLIGGTVLIADSFKSEQVCDSFGGCYPSSHIDTGELLGGTLIEVVGGTTGFVMAFTRDKVTIGVGPGVGAQPALPPAPVQQSARATSAPATDRVPTGLHLGVVF